MVEEQSILVLGENGQLARALKKIIPAATFVGRPDFDLMELSTVDRLPLDRYRYIINASAYTSVDEAETNEGRMFAWKINAQGVAYLAKKLINRNITFVHISTDYIFDGSKSEYVEEDTMSPLNAYGQSKAAGELAVTLLPESYVFRTEWVMGDGKNFVRTMASLAQKDIRPKVVNDQWGRPTFANVLAEAILHVLKNSAPFGVYNISGDGPIVSWQGIAERVFEHFKKSGYVDGLTTEEYFKDKPMAAKRPLSSVFNLQKIKSAGFSPEDWRVSLEQYLNDIEI